MLDGRHEGDLVGSGTMNSVAEALGLSLPECANPWEEPYREKTGQLGDGATLDFAVKCRNTSDTTPRHNH